MENDSKLNVVSSTIPNCTLHIAEVAKALILAVKYREESFDHKSSDEAVAKTDFIVDQEQFYKMDWSTAIKKACDHYSLKDEEELIYTLLVSGSYNESQYWAKRTVEKTVKQTT